MHERKGACSPYVNENGSEALVFSTSSGVWTVSFVYPREVCNVDLSQAGLAYLGQNLASISDYLGITSAASPVAGHLHLP